MNILQVIPYLNPKRGGDVNLCVNLAKELVRRENKVTILTTNFDHDLDYKQQIEKSGVKVVNIEFQFNLGLFIYSPRIKQWLEKNIRLYHIVHLHTFRSYQNIIVCKIAKKYKIPYIIQAHGSVLPFFQKTLLKKIYDNIWGYNLLNNSTRVIACTKIESEQYIKMNVKKNQIEIIPNAIDFTKFEKIPKGILRKKYSLIQSDKIILYLGRINRIKGIDLLLDAFKELNGWNNNFKLLIVGPDDGYLSKIKTKIYEIGEDKIIYTGPLYGKDKLEAYADADIYVLPSVYDNFPITVLEALASATPVIVTNRCGIADMVEEVGRVVDYNEMSLYEAIIDLLSDDELRLSLGEKSKHLIKNKFTFEIIGRQFEEFYKRIG